MVKHFQSHLVFFPDLGNSMVITDLLPGAPFFFWLFSLFFSCSGGAFPIPNTTWKFYDALKLIFRFDLRPCLMPLFSLFITLAWWQRRRPFNCLPCSQCMLEWQLWIFKAPPSPPTPLGKCFNTLNHFTCIQ